jgi:hypothetical protein
MRRCFHLVSTLAWGFTEKAVTTATESRTRADAACRGADFSIQHDGVCRMNPELARRVTQLALEHCKVVAQ